MTFQKLKPSLPKDKIIKEKRLVNGKLTIVETFNGKIVRIFDDDGNIAEDRSANFGNKLPPLPEVKPKPKTEEIPKTDQNAQIEQEEMSNIEDKKPEDALNVDTPKVEVTEYDKIMKMSDEQFKTEIVSMSDSGLEGYMKKLGLDSYEKADIRGKRINLRNIPKVGQDKKEEIQKIEDKKEEIQKIGQEEKSKIEEKPEYVPETLTTTYPPISTSGTEIGIQLISKEETIGSGSRPIKEPSRQIKEPSRPIKTEPATPKEGETTTYIPKIESVIPKIEVPISEPPREDKDMPIPEVNIPVMDRLGKIMKEKNKTKEDKEKLSDIIKSESPKEETPKEVPKAEIPREVPKAEIPISIPKEAPKIEQNKIKKPKEVKHFMAEEDEEIMQERKFEQWLKKNRFQESVEKTAKISEENQEKIEGISNEITNVKEGLGGVENRIDTLKDGLNSILGETKKPITETLGELCEGVDCIKKDVAKYQDIQSELDKKLDSRFSELRERVQQLEEPTFTCDNCGVDGIRPLSSFCPNCGSPIHSWNDDTGQPVKGWTPYWRRIKEAV